jgi:aspartate-semialdehyde dehydrogenase
MKKYKVGVIGGTGMVASALFSLQENHPLVSADPYRGSPVPRERRTRRRSLPAGPCPPHMPEEARNLIVMDAVADL